MYASENLDAILYKRIERTIYINVKDTFLKLSSRSYHSALPINNRNEILNISMIRWKRVRKDFASSFPILSLMAVIQTISFD
jgi:hypothetical protein